jgi:prepilin-type processing-associated H-X9-DG protein
MNTKKSIFTLIELLVVIAVIIMLISMLLPALGKARGTAREIVCSGNLRQIGLALCSYNTDNNDFYPPWYTKINGVNEYWPRIFALADYLQNPGAGNNLFRCQASAFDHYQSASSAYPWSYNCNYAYNSELGATNFNSYYTAGPVRAGKIRGPTQTGAFCESGDRSYSADSSDCCETIGAQGVPDGNEWGAIAYPHNSFANFYWLDSHVSKLRIGAIQRSNWVPVTQ